MTHSPVDFEALVERHQGAVCAIAYAVLRDRAQSEEVAQEAFLIAWQKLPAMTPAPRLPEWVCGIARNLARNAARRRHESALNAEPIATATPLDHLLDREADEHARRALSQLSASERDAVVLFYRGESIAGVASALGISEAAAKKRVTRGRDRLRAGAGTVETSLRATRPGPGFTAACVAALAAASATTATAAPAVRAPARGVVKAALGTAVATPLVVIALVAAPRGSASPLEGSDTTRVRRMSPPEKAVLVGRIRAARTTRLATSHRDQEASELADVVRTYDFAGGSLFETLPEEPPHEHGLVKKRDVRAAIRSMQPLLRECYANVAERLSRRDGTIELVLRIEGEPDVGSTVTSASLAGDPHLATEPELAECMSETLLAIEMPGLDSGGIVDVNYPLTIP